MTEQKIRHALLSVSDKTGIEELADALHQNGVKIISSTGTAKQIKQRDIPVIEVSEHTGFPEIMDGRVKTLHPKIHGGLLARGDEDEQIMREHGIEIIDLLAVNLYPFAKTVSAKHTKEEAIEQIDIGGVALIRAAAKNHSRVIVLVDPGDYATVISALRENNGQISEQKRIELATKAFARTAEYDAMISDWFARDGNALPLSFGAYRKQSDLRYGENPHQTGAFYQRHHGTGPQLLQGKPLSYNNYLDADAAMKTVQEISTNGHAACVIVKHNTPCGAALDGTPQAAYQRAFDTDKDSAFGGIIAFDREVTADVAKAIVEQQFAEVITAPAFSDDALKVLETKNNLRALLMAAQPDQALEQRSVSGGLLIQQADTVRVDEKQLQIVTKRKPQEGDIRDLLFAWQVAKHVRSNAIVFARDQATTGIGAGQTSRIDSVRIAKDKAVAAGFGSGGSVMASEAFFPFRDSLDLAREAGIHAVIQPGGSKNDVDVIAAADELSIAMVFTGIRHFRH